VSAEITRRRLLRLAALALTGAAPSPARAQGYAGLGRDAHGFARVEPGLALAFPRDHGPHPDFRIEWWYLTANLSGDDGAAYGVQWTLFRQAALPGPSRDGFDSQQVWMAHAAATSATAHRFTERFARGGVGQAGVTAAPFHAFIDAWEMRAAPDADPRRLAPMTVTAAARDFAYTLNLGAERPLILQGDNGYSRKSDRGQASYYYSQPYFTAQGTLSLDGRAIAVRGRAWLDREWSSQPLAADQNGWDWFSLHLADDIKLMLFRLRHADGGHFYSGNWIDRDGSHPRPSDGIAMRPLATSRVADSDIPTAWRIELPARGLSIEVTALNAQSYMATRFAYWEGPISFRGSHDGVGYLETTGY
jgi:predicted secreted hydrolase